MSLSAHCSGSSGRFVPLKPHTACAVGHLLQPAPSIVEVTAGCRNVHPQASRGCSSLWPYRHEQLMGSLTANAAHRVCPFPCAGEAITHKIMAPELVSILFLVVALSMALTPFLADGGARLSKAFDKGDMKARPQSFHMYSSVSITSYRCQDAGCWLPNMQLNAFDKGDMKARPQGLGFCWHLYENVHMLVSGAAGCASLRQGRHEGAPARLLWPSIWTPAQDCFDRPPSCSAA